MRPLVEWDADYVIESIADFVDESGQCEVKRCQKLDLSTKDKKREALDVLAKHLCAFANAGGGHLIFGIDQDAKQLDLGVADSYETRPIADWIDQILPGLTKPTVIGAHSRFIHDPMKHAPGFGVVVIEIPMSAARPHWTTRTDESFLRIGRHSYPMNRQTFLDIANRRQDAEPQLEISIRVSNPDCQRLPMLIPHSEMAEQAYYFRMRVENKGTQPARRIEVLISDVERMDGNEWKLVQDFLPQNLAWSYVKTDSLLLLPPGVAKYCDLGHMIDPENRNAFGPMEYGDAFNSLVNLFSIDVVSPTYRPSHLLPAGEYRAKSHSRRRKRHETDVQNAPLAVLKHMGPKRVGHVRESRSNRLGMIICRGSRKGVGNVF